MCNCSGFQFCGDCARSSQCAASLPGLDGTNGKTILTGMSDPVSSVGTDGDFYVVKVSPFKFFYKESGSWTYLGTLKGTDGNGFYVMQEQTLTTAEVSTLNTSAVQILPSLPGDYVYTVVEAIAINNYLNTPWTTGGGVLQLRYSGDTTYVICRWNTTSISQSNVSVTRAGAWNDYYSKNIPLGSPVQLYHSSANPSGGGGSLTIKLVYHIWSVI